jgi:hypothetical protein
MSFSCDVARPFNDQRSCSRPYLSFPSRALMHEFEQLRTSTPKYWQQWVWQTEGIIIYAAIPRFAMNENVKFCSQGTRHKIENWLPTYCWNRAVVRDTREAKGGLVNSALALYTSEFSNQIPIHPMTLIYCSLILAGSEYTVPLSHLKQQNSFFWISPTSLYNGRAVNWWSFETTLSSGFAVSGLRTVTTR